MKQYSFVVEVVLNEDKCPTIILRDPRGSVIKITQSPDVVGSFCEEVIEKLNSVAPSNYNNHEN